MTDETTEPEATPKKARKRRVTTPPKSEVAPVKELTISEFKAYVNGAIELNPDDWHPDVAQWKKISSMILSIKEEAPIVHNVNQAIPVAQHPQAAYNIPPQAQRGSMMDGGGEQQYERINSGPATLDASANPAARPQVERVGGAGLKDPATNAVSSGIKVKTPNVDTSNSEYKSGFN